MDSNPVVTLDKSLYVSELTLYLLKNRRINQVEGPIKDEYLIKSEFQIHIIFFFYVLLFHTLALS